MAINFFTKGRINDFTKTVNPLIANLPVTVFVDGVPGFPEFILFRQDQKTYQFAIKNDDNTPFPLDTIGAVVTFTGKLDIGDTDAAAIFAINCPITDGPGGLCNAFVAKEKTDFTGTEKRILIVSLEYSDGGGSRLTLAQTLMKISPDVNLLL